MIPDRLDKVVEAVADLVAKARDTLAHRMEAGGGIDPAALEREQHALHGLAWLATYGETLKSVAAFARQLAEADRFTEIERLLTGILFGEYLEQIIGGIPMNQQEFARPGHLGLEAADLAALQSAAAPLIAEGSTRDKRARLVQLMIETGGRPTVGDLRP